MIIWLDHLIFGNGRGLKSPYWNDVFYWIEGEFYKRTGYFGCQLESFQWTHPKAQERRELLGRKFKPFTSNRIFGRVRVTWALTELSPDSELAHEQLEQFFKDLKNI